MRGSSAAAGAPPRAVAPAVRAAAPARRRAAAPRLAAARASIRWPPRKAAAPAGKRPGLHQLARDVEVAPLECGSSGAAVVVRAQHAPARGARQRREQARTPCRCGRARRARAGRDRRRAPPPRRPPSPSAAGRGRTARAAGRARRGGRGGAGARPGGGARARSASSCFAAGETDEAVALVDQAVELGQALAQHRRAPARTRL